MIEILAPCGNYETLELAIRCGANAVYVGGEKFSARQGANSFPPDVLEKACRFCHLYGARLYLALNTLLGDREFDECETLIRNAVHCGVDAIIVQDIGVLSLLREVAPTMPIHASTQMSIHSPRGVAMAREIGCSRVVVARECSLVDLKAICQEPTEIEVFVHGALCMSVSGQCLYSAMIGGRSANRGACASACRLPWKCPHSKKTRAKTNTEHMLSLKDLSLLDHVGTLEEIGVTSLKIEGRIKRPEYVACAVLALRSAIEGDVCHRQLLEKIFSRQGFTDGYFMGKKQAMFGFRGKEEVLSSQEVLRQIQALAKQERRLCEVDFSLTLVDPETPSRIVAKASDGISVTLDGERPLVPEKAPLQKDLVERQMRKLGGTIYSLGVTSLDNPQGLTLASSALNAMRREAVTTLASTRIVQNTVIHPLQERMELISPSYKATKRAAQLRFHVRTHEQLACVQGEGVIACVPFSLAKTLSPREGLWLETARLLENEEHSYAQLAQLRKKGFTQLLCHSLGFLHMGRELGFTVHGGLGIPVSNSQTARELGSLGVQSLTACLESRARAMREIGQYIPLGVFVYGHVPLMLFRVCPLKERTGCHSGKCELLDRTGERFTLQCSQSYQELLHARCLWLFDKLDYFSGISFWDCYLTQENPQQIQGIFRAHREKQSPSIAHFTRGIALRGGIE